MAVSFELSSSGGGSRAGHGATRLQKAVTGSAKWKVCGLSCSFVVVCYIGLCWYAAKVFVTLHPRVRAISRDGRPWTPTNVSKLWRRGLADLPECTSDELLESFESFSASHPFQRVYFNSRPGTAGQDTVRLAGWWLPAAPAPSGTGGGDGASATSLRVVLQHGYRRNSLDHTVQLTGYFLRTVGISVLLVDLRDHGASDASQNAHVTWGWAYPLDLLGAWDYAVADPDGLLGGAVDPASVGLLGFSMGGFVTATAFGMEPSVPAVWLDGPAFRVKDVLREGIQRRSHGNRVLAALVAPLAVKFAKWMTGADLSLYSPTSVLSNNTAHSDAPRIAALLRANPQNDSIADEDGAGVDDDTAPPRAVAIAGNTVDTTVPEHQIRGMLDLFRESPRKFEVREAWIPTMRCGAGSHCSMHTWRPMEYLSKLCTFWHEALKGGDFRVCVFDDMPWFEDCPTEECPAWPWGSAKDPSAAAAAQQRFA